MAKHTVANDGNTVEIMESQKISMSLSIVDTHDTPMGLGDGASPTSKESFSLSDRTDHRVRITKDTDLSNAPSSVHSEESSYHVGEPPSLSTPVSSHHDAGSSNEPSPDEDKSITVPNDDDTTHGVPSSHTVVVHPDNEDEDQGNLLGTQDTTSPPIPEDSKMNSLSAPQEEDDQVDVSSPQQDDTSTIPCGKARCKDGNDDVDFIHRLWKVSPLKDSDMFRRSQKPRSPVSYGLRWHIALHVKALATTWDLVYLVTKRVRHLNVLELTVSKAPMEEGIAILNNYLVLMNDHEIKT
ncbi:MAG: hypothetical protein LC687_03930, partial [Actinobacteria bacterium]|nr:hypothetical protein [Actinomycetota bacterium]